jgi:hypothetical protein
MKRLILISIIFSIISCKRNSTEKLLIGKWILDSATTIEGRYYGRDFNRTITIKNKTDYTYSWNGSCVLGSYDGKYFIAYNPKRYTKTIVFIPNIDTAYVNKERTPYMVFDIVSLSNDRLEGISETKRKYADTFPNSLEKEMNESYVYKKIKD